MDGFGSDVEVVVEVGALAALIGLCVWIGIGDILDSARGQNWRAQIQVRVVVKTRSRNLRPYQQ